MVLRSNGVDFICRWYPLSALLHRQQEKQQQRQQNGLEIKAVRRARNLWAGSGATAAHHHPHHSLPRSRFGRCQCQRLLRGLAETLRPRSTCLWLWIATSSAVWAAVACGCCCCSFWYCYSCWYCSCCCCCCFQCCCCCRVPFAVGCNDGGA